MNACTCDVCAHANTCMYAHAMTCVYCVCALMKMCACMYVTTRAHVETCAVKRERDDLRQANAKLDTTDRYTNLAAV